MIRIFFPTIIILASILSGCSFSPFKSDTESQQDAQEEARTQEQERLASAIERKDIVLGMPMTDVFRVWGEPRGIEQAGMVDSGNQRWTYFDGVSKLGRLRIIYFERGKVAGWETVQR